jgi:hypothetical protein
MRENNCILSPKQYSCIYKVSFLSLVSTGYACYRGHYGLAFVPGGTFITSIIYWRKPDYSWRRYLDMTYVTSGLCYQLIRAYYSEYPRLYYTTAGIAVLFYGLGIHFYKKKQYWCSTYAHCMLHVFGNISNLILYSGEILPMTELIQNISF